MNIHYAAHREGVFDSVDDALAHAQLSPQQIEFAKANARINGDESVWFPINTDYGALVTPGNNGFVLWRGFYGKDWRGSYDDALCVTQEFMDHGVLGTWAVFEYAPLARSQTN